MGDVRELSRVGTVISLAPLGRDGTGEIVASWWTEALGDVVRIHPHKSDTTAATMIVYGDDLARLLTTTGHAA